MHTQRLKTRELVSASLFVALIALGAQLRIPVPVVPFTLQFLFTTLAGFFLGPRGGLSATGGYLLLGLAGLPIFSQGGGPGYIFNPSFGYLIGFCAGAWITGLLSEKLGKNIKASLKAAFAGLSAVYLCGMLYCWLLSNFVTGTPVALWPLFLYCFLLAVPGDIILCLISATIFVRVSERSGSFYVC